MGNANVANYSYSRAFPSFSLFINILLLQLASFLFIRERKIQSTEREEQRENPKPSRKFSLWLFFSLGPHFSRFLSQITFSSLSPSSSSPISLDYKTMVFWVFGYGSLVWNPGFEYDDKVMGFIKDYRRVFDLACIDHRGTPEHPARTCTLEQSEGTICWGAAYCVRGGAERERLAMQYLERRECEYDHKSLVDFYKEDDSSGPALTGVIVFMSTPDKVSNKYYLGPAPLEDMARQIATAFGPCGNNRDYLFRLEKAMHDIGHEDDYVIELANEVRKVLGIAGKDSNGFVQLQIKDRKPTNSHVTMNMSQHIPSLQLHPLPRQEAVAMDS